MDKRGGMVWACVLKAGPHYSPPLNMEADSNLTLYNFIEWFHAKRKIVIGAAIAIVVVVAALTLMSWKRASDEAAASQALYSLPSVLALNSKPDPADSTTLLNVAKEHPGTTAGTVAQLLGAQRLFINGKYSEAWQAFTDFATSHVGDPLVAQAQIGIAACLEAEGKTSDAVLKYKEIAASYSSDAEIVFPIKLTLGRLSEAENRPDQADGYYEELARFNAPYDPYVGEAKDRLRLLLAKHPELEKGATGNPYEANLLNPSAAEMQLSTPETQTNQTAPAKATPSNAAAPVKP